MEGGDRPEFAFFLPGRGGNLRLALQSPTTWWPIEQDYHIDDFAFFRPCAREVGESY